MFPHPDQLAAVAADRITIAPSMAEAPIGSSDLVFVDGRIVGPPRLRKDWLLIDDALKRTFRNAEIAAPPALRDSGGDPDAALRLARQRYRDAAVELHQLATTEQPPRMRAAAGPRRA